MPLPLELVMPSHLSTDQLAELRVALAAQRDELKRQLEGQLGDLSRVDHARELIEKDVDDAAQQDSERDIDQIRTEQMMADFAAITLALERMDRSDFGLCRDCGEPIEFLRLRARPWVVSCVRCQTAREQTQGRHAATI